jgi:hypothetical protein
MAVSNDAMAFTGLLSLSQHIPRCTTIWRRYPYKASHYAKYLGRSIYTAQRASM